MGYGIVMWLDDIAARAAQTADLGADLRKVLDGIGTYPAEVVDVRRQGPWNVAGVHHSSAFALYTASAHGLTPAPTGSGLDEDDPEAFGWVSTLTGGSMARIERDALRHPHRLEVAMARGVTVAEALYGRHDLATSTGSAWWFYADAADDLDSIDDATLGSRVAAMIATRNDPSMRVGAHTNALNRAGSLLDADAQVTLVWSGNRLCHTSELTDPERSRLHPGRT